MLDDYGVDRMKAFPLIVALMFLAGPTAADSPTLHTAFVFFTHEPDIPGDASTVYYVDNLRRVMTVTTTFSNWNCMREPVARVRDGRWEGHFSCTSATQADGKVLITSVGADCPANVVTPLRVNTGTVTEVDMASHGVKMMEFTAGCTTSVEVPRRGEVRP